MAGFDFPLIILEKLRKMREFVREHAKNQNHCMAVQFIKNICRIPKSDALSLFIQPKETREFHGRRYILEEAIRGDFALVKAKRADKVNGQTHETNSPNYSRSKMRNFGCYL